jgi:type IV pilus assembly protein PilF
MRRSTSLRLLPAALVLFVAGSIAAEPEYRLKGVLQPPAKAVVTLDGFTTTFSGSILVESNGEFEFKALRAGTYTLIVGVPNRGEIRRTVEIGPGTADSKNCVPLTIPLEESLFSRGLARRQGTVPVQELAVPEKARKAYAEAQRQLARRNQKKAIESLQTAVRIAPDFSGAWNNLGTMYYKSAQYEKAEESFRAALAASPESFEPLVNLGGVLLTLNRPSEAYTFNLYSVLERPEDALANSQMGMNYFALGRLDLARKYLDQARRIDPGHFSRPQLLLAEICLRKGDKRGAARELEEYLRYHPDVPNRARIEESIRKLKADAGEML